MTAEEDLLAADTLTVEESMADRQQKIIDQANASLSMAVQEKSRMMGARAATHSPRSAFRGRRQFKKKRDKGLTRLFQIQGLVEAAVLCVRVSVCVFFVHPCFRPLFEMLQFFALF